jgi:fructuronate reductase
MILPKYDRNAHAIGIVHLGIGAFHRAHQAVYTDTALGLSGGNWRIQGVSLRSPSVRDQLVPQDSLFTVVEKTEKLPQYRLVGSIGDVSFAPENPQGLIQRMADPDTRIVSLTITEKGYLHDPAKGRLNPKDSDVEHDLKNPDRPRTAIGYLVGALAKRRKAGSAPFTALSCDNLPQNGQTLKNVVLDFATLIDDRLARWIEEHVAFPCCMVDRIVPATTPADKQQVEKALGLRDEAPVVTEPFCQWVLEDNFPQGRPAWEKAGAIFSSQVGAFEVMKLRFLNGSHSTLAYLGYLAGKASIAECMQWDALKTLVETLMRREILPTVRTPDGYDAGSYIDALIQRFSNPGLYHRTWQIAMDGSQKLPQRLLDTIRDQLAGSRDIDILCLAVAGWMRYVCGIDEKGDAIEISDPMAHEFAKQTSNFRDKPDKTVERLLNLTEIFGTDLPNQDLFRDRVKNAFRGLCTLGTRETVQRFLNNTATAVL